MIFRDDVLAGRVAVVTGDGTGMGADMALGFAAVGADVAVLSRDLDHLNPVAEQIRDLGRRAEAPLPQRVARRSAATTRGHRSPGPCPWASSVRPPTSRTRRSSWRRTPGGSSPAKRSTYGGHGWAGYDLPG